ncbi:MAG: hypothetical protein AB2385_08025 [Symbiobacterium sp.]|uniref:hypothetical protein n=1 Tax=Symbiobacterium sp. TaxID=1971213 RepID=UPI0034644E2C
MNLRQLRWPVVLAALAVTLGGLFGGSQLVKSRTVDQPLAAALASVDGLDSYQVERVGDIQEIRIAPGPGASLRATYTAVDRQARQILAGAPYTIAVADRRGAALAAVATRLDLYVQEGVATGAFVAMADRIAAEVEALGAEADVAVDGERVYVTVRKGDEYLYSVVDRPGWPVAVPVTGGAGQ